MLVDISAVGGCISSLGRRLCKTFFAAATQIYCFVTTIWLRTLTHLDEHFEPGFRIFHSSRTTPREGWVHPKCSPPSTAIICPVTDGAAIR